MRSLRIGGRTVTGGVGILAFFLSSAALIAQAPAAADDVGSKVWIGKAKEYEDYLRTA